MPKKSVVSLSNLNLLCITLLADALIIQHKKFVSKSQPKYAAPYLAKLAAETISDFRLYKAFLYSTLGSNEFLFSEAAIRGVLKKRFSEKL